MKKILLFFLLQAMWIMQVHSQDTISVDYVRTLTHEFQIENGKLIGNGANFLKDEFNNSQFVLIGETHGDAKISEFTNAILPELAEMEFKYFCLEIGPESTKILKEICSKVPNVQSALFKFYSDYYVKVKDKPIPFFEGKEDADFLQSALENNFSLFGIDQEYYSSTLLLLDKLKSLDNGFSSELIYDRACQYVREEQLKSKENKNYPMTENFLNSSILQDFFNNLDTTNFEISNIIHNLKLSWEIYNQHSKNRIKSLTLRAELMKKEFSKNYKLFLERDANPKILIKMGSFHTERGLSSNSVYDIGTLVSELADFNRTQDLNIGFMFRFFKDEEEPSGYFDNSIGTSDWLLQRRALMLQGKIDQWVVIDLRKLREPCLNKQLWCYPAIRELMFKMDLIVIPPMDREIEINYKTEE
ncbi:MAG TPA: hypothetical protein PK246_09810 [Saprospiraceae bacterium]|nr:hypothetical protein [Saprospiraceae bacterium]